MRGGAGGGDDGRSWDSVPAAFNSVKIPTSCIEFQEMSDRFEFYELSCLIFKSDAIPSKGSVETVSGRGRPLRGSIGPPHRPEEAQAGRGNRDAA